MPKLIKLVNNKRFKLFIWIIILVPVGLATKFYNGPLDYWIANKFSGIIYIMFWSFLFALLFKNKSPGIICLIVLLVTVFLELTQLISTPVLEDLRNNFIFRSLIGNSFSWSDFPYYIIGSLISYINLFCITYR